MNPWSDIFFLHPGMLDHAIANPSDCIADVATLEDIICTQELIGQFAADHGLQLNKEERKALGEIGCMEEYDDFVEQAKNTLIENLLTEHPELGFSISETEYIKNNFTIYLEVKSFLDKHKLESESKVNLSKAIASSYVTILHEENLSTLDFDLGSVGDFNDPYWNIAKDLLLDAIKELLVDLIPGGTLVTLGPELYNDLQSGNYMDAMFNAADIVINEADAFFPIAKIGSFSLGAVKEDFCCF